MRMRASSPALCTDRLFFTIFKQRWGFTWKAPKLYTTLTLYVDTYIYMEYGMCVGIHLRIPISHIPARATSAVSPPRPPPAPAPRPPHPRSP